MVNPIRFFLLAIFLTITSIIQLGNGYHNLQKRMVDLRSRKWSNGVIPFSRYPQPKMPVVFRLVETENFDGKEIGQILRALATLEDVSCLRFQLKDSAETSFFQFVRRYAGCRNERPLPHGDGPIVINLGRDDSGNCAAVETVIHEALHALGFVHEHQRSDRDEHLVTYLENLWDHGNAFAFEKVDTSTHFAYYQPYDYNSIMHYPWNFMSSSLEKPVILPRTNVYMGLLGSVTENSVNGLTSYDIMKINMLYNCQPNKGYLINRTELVQISGRHGHCDQSRNTQQHYILCYHRKASGLCMSANVTVRGIVRSECPASCGCCPTERDPVPCSDTYLTRGPQGESTSSTDTTTTSTTITSTTETTTIETTTETLFSTFLPTSVSLATTVTAETEFLNTATTLYETRTFPYITKKIGIVSDVNIRKARET